MDKMILLIDEEREPLIHYVRVLKRFEYRVVQCFDPDKALALIESGELAPDAILLDVMMPPTAGFPREKTQDGLTTGVLVYDEIRRLRPQVPVVVLTNVSDQETLQHIQENGRTRIAQKMDYPPYQLAQLLQDLLSDTTNQFSVNTREVDHNAVQHS